MNLSSIASQNTPVTPSSVRDQVGIAVLKKAMDIEAQNALQLLQALPQVSNNPPNLGGSVDVTA